VIERHMLMSYLTRRWTASSCELREVVGL